MIAATFRAIDHLPQPFQFCATGASIGTALAAFFEQIQGPAAGVGASLSVLWLALQIFTWARNEVRAWKAKKKGS